MIGTDSPSVDSELVATFLELQRLSSEKFHELGDLLLPSIVEGLGGLRKLGLNTEGKTRKGTPDSFIGETPATCCVAVEYTTQAKDLSKKLGADYAKVRQECPLARLIVLCVSRELDGADADTLHADAQRNGIVLRIVHGENLSRALCRVRQDLRARFLNIPIDAHTFGSLVRQMGETLELSATGKVEGNALGNFVVRPALDRAVREATYRSFGGLYLIVAPAGFGKTTWSFEHAKRHGGAEPVFWSAATDLAVAALDPISLAVVQAAYGSPDPQRINELADLLRREKRGLRLILDAIDEVKDYREFTRNLKAFCKSPLAKVANVLMTCREAAIPMLRQEVGAAFPELFQPVEFGNGPGTGIMQLGELDRDRAFALLLKSGATQEQARTVENALPETYRGNALFLLRSLERLKKGLPSLGAQEPRMWIEAFAEDFTVDIANRLRDQGRRPGLGTIRTFLEEVALLILKSTSDIATEEQVRGIGGASEEGENTLWGRAIQSGLLARRSSGVGFAHSIFLEHFAASALSRGGDVATWVERLRGDSRHEVLVRLVMSQAAPTESLRLLLKQEPIAACEVASRLATVEEPALRQGIVDAAAELLKSRYLSDVARGLELLRGLRWPESTQCAADWFNGLSADAKINWMSRTAELFLSHQEIGAFHVILGHGNLAFEWYEPSFVARVSSLSAPFRAALREKARRALSDAPQDGWARERLTKLLAILGDHWLVDYLRARLEKSLLMNFEHRALIHLNTTESIFVYAESVEQYWKQRTAERQADSDGYYQYMLKGTDVLMFPNDALKELVADALAIGDLRRAWFAHEWAGFLGDEALLEPYYAATRRFPSAFWIRNQTLISNIVKHSGAAHAIEMYRKYDDQQVRRDIVYCIYDAPGPETETFLRERLNEEALQFCAMQSLGFIGGISAAPAIQNLLRSPNFDVRFMAASVLGRLRYTPAVSELALGLRSDEGFQFAKSLGKLGTPTAYAALHDAFVAASSSEQRKHILEALVHRRDPEGLAAARALLPESTDARAMIASAIGYPDFEERPNEIDDLGLPLNDPDLLRYAIDSAREAVASGRSTSLLDHSLRGVACFDAPAAIAFLADVASGLVQAKSENLLPPNEGRREARRLLAIKGQMPFQREVVDEELDAMRAEIPSWEKRSLSRWPQPVVRQALLERIVRGEKLHVWLELLQWFAEPADDKVFSDYETHDDDNIADICHRYLRSRRAFA